jgi:hypothetical protein
VFKVTFERWIEEANERTFADLVHDSFAEFKAVAAGSARTGGSADRASS